MDNTAFVINWSCCTIFNCLCHIIDVDIITKYFACAAVFCGDRGSCEPDVGCIGKRISYDTGSADDGFCFNFAVVFLLDYNFLIETILPAMSLIRHYNDVPSFRKRFVAFFKLLHGREDYAVCLSVCKQFFQILAALCVLRRLPEEIFATRELPVQLVIQIITVSDYNDSGAFQCFLQIVCIEDHGQ